MKTKHHLFLSIFALAVIVQISACMHPRPTINKANPAFVKYISGFTSGMVSRRTAIRIELTHGLNESSLDSVFDQSSATLDSMAVYNASLRAATVLSSIPDSALRGNALSVSQAAANIPLKASYTTAPLPDSSLLADAFTFEPVIKGHAIWVSDKVIKFIPDDALPQGQFYNCEFKLKNVTKVDAGFETFNFQLSTYAQNLFVTLDGLRSYNESDIEWQKLTGKIGTTDFEDTTNIRKVITVTQNGKPLPVHIENNYNNNEFYFYVDSIERKEKAGKVLVSWNGKHINAISSGSQEINVPSLGDFSITDAKVVDDGDQYVDLTFSDPIAANQNLKGIVLIQGLTDLTYTIELNHVKIFLGNRTVGDKLLTVTTGVKNFKGYKMDLPYTENLHFDEPGPLVRIKGSGCILPNSNGLIFPFEAVSLKAVDVRVIKIFENNVHQFLQVNSLDGNDGMRRVGKIVVEKQIRLDADKKLNLKQWNTFVIDLNKLITPDPGAIYRISIKFEKSYTTCDCNTETASAEKNTGKEPEEKDDWNEQEWGYYDFDEGYDSYDYYHEESSPCDEQYYYGKAVSRNILASDLGLIYKLDDNKLSHAFVSNMITAKPLAGVTIEYYDYVKQRIAIGVTDANGMLDLQLECKPFLMLAKYAKQRGYLKLLDGNANSLSKFDIEGEVVQKGVKGFIYGERGVWRPGDSLYLNFILEDKEKRLPPNHPVKFELQDPNGQVIYQVTKTKHLNGLYDFRTATTPEAPTGNYTALVKIGNRVFKEYFKIETVKPNRLKIYLDFDRDKMNDTTAKLSVKWLHGAIARNLHALVNVSVNQSKTTFPKYGGYEFDSPVRSYSSNTELVFDGNLDDKGEALLKTSLNVGQTASGMLRTTYISKVFEEGGDFSIDRYSVPYSPYKIYVGLHIPDTKNYDNTLETGNTYKFDVVTVDEKGALANSGKLQVKIYKIQWRWWYERNEDDLANYISRSGTLILKDTLIKTTEGRAAFKFHVNYPEYGRYLITVTDLVNGHQTGKVIYIDWPYWQRGNRSSNENANMLNFACNKEKYTTGEQVKLSFPSPSDGMALVSIESGTRVLKKFWIATKKGETTSEFPATADMAPNAYVHVTLIQPHASTKNDLPIRMYGVVPIFVDEPASHLNPEIQMQDVLKPESTTTIKVKEKNGRKMIYTLSIVDEGLLDITRFKTPQPWNTFYAREALGVKTWDMYDNVIGAFAGKLDKLLSIGGDGDGDAGKGLKANRFKPMVKFAGPFTLQANETKTHIVNIPNYIGSVRVMVVAENSTAYGNAEKAVAVRKPLMILATLPRVLGPGEHLSLPVDVFAMEKQVKDVNVLVEVNDLLSLDGNKQQVMHFTQTGDEVINFKLNVASKIGIAKVKITAVCGKEKAVQEIELDVRTPNPKVVDGVEMILEPGKSWNSEINFKGIAGTNKATVEFSSIPSMGLEKRLDYLIQYPHGCIEQTTSSVFPQLYVCNLVEMKEIEKNKISKNIKAGLKRLQLFQTANGGFSYWPGENGDSEWGSNYAGHFFIEAEKQGYALPDNLKARWLKYQQQQARNWSNDNSSYAHAHGNESNQAIQAYRLFVLALSNNAELGAMNRLREEKNIGEAARWRLAAAYQLIGQQEVAMKLIHGLSTAVIPYRELSYSYGSETRDKAMILETLSLLGEKTKAWPLAREISKSLSGEYYMNTQETAYGLLAMCEFIGAKGDNSEISISGYLNGGAGKSEISKKTMIQLHYNETAIAKKGTVSFTNTGKSTLFGKLIVEGVPLTGDQTAASNNLVMEITYKDMKGVILQPDKLVQGTDFIAEVKMTNPGTRGFLQEMTLNQIFPSGWEIHNTRLDGTGTSNVSRYQDIRDDRIYTYYDLLPNSSKTFAIQLNATYLGKFYLPTVYSEAMYDNTINARVPGRWVEVVKE
jgi:uncharacterized protein YfaS (alpha-2-macroglobulin family)